MELDLVWVRQLYLTSPDLKVPRINWMVGTPF